jgi:hypothetical protein
MMSGSGLQFYYRYFIRMRLHCGHLACHLIYVTIQAQPRCLWSSTTVSCGSPTVVTRAPFWLVRSVGAATRGAEARATTGSVAPAVRGGGVVADRAADGRPGWSRRR